MSQKIHRNNVFGKVEITAQRHQKITETKSQLFCIRKYGFMTLNLASSTT